MNPHVVIDEQRCKVIIIRDFLNNTIDVQEQLNALEYKQLESEKGKKYKNNALQPRLTYETTLNTTLNELKTNIEQTQSLKFDDLVTVIQYRNGRDSFNQHSELEYKDLCLLSIGETRNLIIKERGISPKLTRVFSEPLKNGDLCLMLGVNTQSIFTHGINKTKKKHNKTFHIYFKKKLI